MDKKSSVREGALTTLLPHIIQCQEIDNQLENILNCTLSALEKGSGIATACQIIERVVALNPLLGGMRPVIASLLDSMERQYKSSQPALFTALFRCTAWCLALTSTFNPDFTDTSQFSTQLFTILTQALKYESKLYYTHSLNLIAGLTSAYISLIPPYRAGWGYDRFVSLLLFFMTKNYQPELASRVFATSLNGLLLAVSYKNDPTLVALYPEEIVDGYRNQISTDCDEDDGYYLPLDSDMSDPATDEVAIPIINWPFDKLIARVKAIFDGDSMSLENDYNDEDLEMFQMSISNDFDNIQNQFKLAQQNKDSPDHVKSALVLPEVFNGKHPLHRHYPDHYTSFDGRALYFLLDIFGLKWDQLLNWPYLGELFASHAIRERCQNDLDKAMKGENAPTTNYARRMGKKEADVNIRAAREAKMGQLSELIDNEMDLGSL